MSNYKVGYGNPPVASRFRAGVSGNAKAVRSAKSRRLPSTSRGYSILRSSIERVAESRLRPIARLLSERSLTMPSAAILAPPLWSSGLWGAPSAIADPASTTFSSRTGCPTTLIKSRARKPRMSPPAAMGRL
jgi:hypothetical protein